ncbi:hypothetical protein [Rickettsia endosymbiont of Ceutorhynchus obstrictus]|uniref:hypothetical protein n=1 Tax=Rickettsia endosymbiont of Ceutorhynchus obstrictus TaxID=3066249 RepID=UPI0031329EAE
MILYIGRSIPLLLYLDLHNNKMGDEGARLIAELLKTNTSLIYLDLAMNNISNEGARAVIEALQKNINITDLDLGENNIDHENTEIIEGYLQRNKSFREEQNIFQTIVEDINTKIVDSKTINDNDKPMMQDIIKNVAYKGEALIYKAGIEQITNYMQELLSKSKITKGNIIDLADQLNEVIDYQNINYDAIILGVDSAFM